MKIAVFHQFMDNIGGAEIVALTLARAFAADLYTTNVDVSKIRAMGYADLVPRIISIGRVPTNAPFRHQLALWRFRRLNLKKKYDCYIIAGDWAMSAAVNNRPNIWYVHSPLNELWEWRDYIRRTVLSLWKRPIFDLWVWFNRRLSLGYAKHVDVWIANSLNTQKRIKKYYNKEATVIHPPIYTSGYTWLPDKGYWLSVNRLLNHKRIDLQMKAFSSLPHEQLIIVGSYEKKARQFETYRRYLESIRPPNVEIINWIDDGRLKELYAECKGFIATARDEDFGMTPVEAMASGKPVIAANEGGYRESVTDGITGILINDIDEKKLAQAIMEVNGILKNYSMRYRNICQMQARKSDTGQFIELIRKVTEEIKIQ